MFYVKIFSSICFFFKGLWNAKIFLRFQHIVFDIESMHKTDAAVFSSTKLQKKLKKFLSSISMHCITFMQKIISKTMCWNFFLSEALFFEIILKVCIDSNLRNPPPNLLNTKIYYFAFLEQNIIYI